MTPGGIDWLLVDLQNNVEAAEAYVHVCYRVTSDAGLQEAAQIESDFDPSFQTLDWHDLQVRRGSAITDRLDLDKIKIIQQELDLDRYEYNGRLTALLMLDDIRVGDIIDYSYTLHGRNPVFAGRFQEEYRERGSEPIEKERIRVLVSAKRSLQAASTGGAVLREEINEHEGLRDYVWVGDHLSAIEPDPQLPDWFNPYPFLQLSEFPTWGTVVDWAYPLYQVPEALSPELRAQSAALASGGKTDAEKACLILDFVQQKVRYLGMELGSSSHRPSPPDEVLRRRFGDCKDKTLLFCALLRCVGLEAVPAFTHSSRRQSIQEWLPSSDVFNHVIARLTIGDRTYWLDPTLGEQGGALEDRFVPDYGFALPIAQGVDRLEPVAGPASARGSCSIAETYSVPGTDQPAGLSVTTRYHGGSADSMRAFLKQVSESEVAKIALNERSKRFSHLQAKGPVRWTDDLAANEVTTTSEYTIGQFWKKSDDRGKLTADVRPGVLLPFIQTPESMNRSAPLGIAYPVKIAYQATIELPRPWPIDQNNFKIDDEFLSASCLFATSGRTVTIDETLETRGDAVPANRVEDYADDLQKMRRACGLELSYDPALAVEASRFRLNWFFIGAMALGAAAGAWLFRRLGRSRPEAVPLPFVPPKFYGLNGWLIIVGLSVSALPFVFLARVYQHCTLWLNLRLWERMPHVSSIQNVGGTRALILAECAYAAGSLVFSSALVKLFYSRDRRFPAGYIIVLAAGPIFTLFDTLANAALHSLTYPNLILVYRTALPAAIWIPYLCVSRRVRATFVNARASRAVEVAPVAEPVSRPIEKKARKHHSKLGFASVAITLAVALGSAALNLQVQAINAHPSEYGGVHADYKFIGIVDVLLFLANFVGLGLGIAALLQRTKKLIVGAFGFGASALALVLFVISFASAGIADSIARAPAPAIASDQPPLPILAPQVEPLPTELQAGDEVAVTVVSTETNNLDEAGRENLRRLIQRKINLKMTGGRRTRPEKRFLVEVKMKTYDYRGTGIEVSEALPLSLQADVRVLVLPTRDAVCNFATSISVSASTMSSAPTESALADSVVNAATTATFWSKPRVN